MNPILVLCLGNEVLCDDALGFFASQRLCAELPADDTTDIVYSSIAGFSLLDLLNERKRVLIVDVIQTGGTPGTIHFFPAGNLTPSQQLINSHQISLPTALALGRQFGLALPETVDVIAVEAQDVETLSETMTSPVARALDEAVARIKQWIFDTRGELNTHVTRKQTATVA